jgi:hypothetical protein
MDLDAKDNGEERKRRLPSPTVSSPTSTIGENAVLLKVSVAHRRPEFALALSPFHREASEDSGGQCHDRNHHLESLLDVVMDIVTLQGIQVVSADVHL